MANDNHVRLLTLEADAIFGLEPTPTSSSHVLRDPALHALLICSVRHAGGVVTALSPSLASRCAASPETVVARAAAALADLPRLFRLRADGAAPPAVLVHLQDALGLPSHAIAGGPTWIVPDAMRRAFSWAGGEGLPAGVRVVTSAREGDRALVAGLSRPSTWEEAGWAEAMTAPGAPTWAVAVYEEGGAVGEIVCVCHTPARNDEVAEAGIWTREDWRGRGLAARTVAAWATAHPPQTRTLFYSTARENAASQAVARTLGLEEFGYIWKLLVI
ncbi:Acyl-CoA N-acyltransferase [Cordyceps fumosorosea ARSEF 2679]|uniref:Acyl-CoA N-acyltransferase n=1 Tax=Cordyceps fumosorosea (strain ARSEF 2679) TaxID=1081104 RepID=A0A162MB05_CORFA|nr:Acyl-CoA N-acyltransferase [Cordyceps fumosorosea ARSEF 2679]OAA53570.1 Acyl-CoA N-acyltransferase [Cordyceps fumosorosea ARSEF 2679]